MSTLGFSLKQAAVTLQHKAEPDGLYVEDIFATFGHRDRALLVAFLAAPFLQPVPLVGLSTPLGGLIAVAGFFILVGRPLWLPQKILRTHVKASLILSCCKFLISTLSKTERFIKPRFGFSSKKSVRIFNGLLIMIYGLLLALPLPIPFTNSIPAWFLVLNALGELEEDGLILGLSYLLAFAGFVFFLGLGAGILDVFEWLKARFF